MNEHITINQQTTSLITSKQAWHYRVVPAGSTNGGIQFYTDEKTIYQGLEDELELITGKKIYLQQIASETIQQLLELHYQKGQQDARQQNAYYHGDADSFLTHLISEAKNLHSSDIH